MRELHRSSFQYWCRNLREIIATPAGKRLSPIFVPPSPPNEGYLDQHSGARYSEAERRAAAATPRVPGVHPSKGAALRLKREPRRPEPAQPVRSGDSGCLLLGAYLVFSAVLLGVSMRGWWWDHRLAWPALALDDSAFLAAVYFTEAPGDDFTSPFLALFRLLDARGHHSLGLARHCGDFGSRCDLPPQERPRSLTQQRGGSPAAHHSRNGNGGRDAARQREISSPKGAKPSSDIQRNRAFFR